MNQRDVRLALALIDALRVDGYAVLYTEAPEARTLILEDTAEEGLEICLSQNSTRSGIEYSLANERTFIPWSQILDVM